MNFPILTLIFLIVHSRFGFCDESSAECFARYFNEKTVDISRMEQRRDGRFLDAKLAVDAKDCATQCCNTLSGEQTTDRCNMALYYPTRGEDDTCYLIHCLEGKTCEMESTGNSFASTIFMYDHKPPPLTPKPAPLPPSEPAPPIDTPIDTDQGVSQSGRLNKRAEAQAVSAVTLSVLVMVGVVVMGVAMVATHRLYQRHVRYREYQVQNDRDRETQTLFKDSN